MLDEMCAGLRTVFGTANALTLPISGTGSAGHGGGASSTCSARATSRSIGVNGLFGQRMCEVASRCGAEVVAVDARVGARRSTPSACSPPTRRPRSSRSCTPRRPPACAPTSPPIGAGKGDALLLVDCVTSLGGIEVDVDGWGVDLAYGGTQKCLGVPPGLAPLTVSERARERLVERSQSWYLDLRLIGAYTGAATGAAPTTTPRPISMMQSLHGGLGTCSTRGSPPAWARHAECGELRAGRPESLGFELFAAEGSAPARSSPRCACPTASTTPRCAPRCSTGTASRSAAGVGAYAGTVWRIGCMGHTARAATSSASSARSATLARVIVRN